MKRFLNVLILLFFTYSTFCQDSTMKEDLEGRMQYEMRRIIDPVTGKIPYFELEKAKNTVKEASYTKNAMPNIRWYERGPNNVAGRVRALAFDPNDVSNKKVFAGGVTGGLWYNNDITNKNSSWNKVNDFWENIFVNCIGVNKNNPQVMYVGTGEFEVGVNFYSEFEGGGIYKSIDGGLNWLRLSNTVPNSTYGTINYAMRFIKKIIINNLGHIFVATPNGLIKSINGGETWNFTNLTTSAVYDIEISETGVLYAAIKSSNRPNLFKSFDNGNNWIDITPDIETLYDKRIEIAISKSQDDTHQYIYVLYTGQTTERIFKKSENGGQSWTTLDSPSYIDGYNFTSNQAYYNLCLEIHPQNPNHILIGGTNMSRSIDGGLSWNFSMNYWRNHPDYHTFKFRPNNNNEVILSTDGGIYYSQNLGDSQLINPTFEPRNKDLNITQFYSIAMRNNAGDGYIIAGSQDNGTQALKGSYKSISEGESINGGDGTLCFIDQNEPLIQITSMQNGDFSFESYNGSYFFSPSDKKFLHPAEYDSNINTFYTYDKVRNDSTIFTKIKINANTFSKSEFGITTSIHPYYIKSGKSPNTIFVAGENFCKIFKITNTNLINPTVICIADNNDFMGDISSIDIGNTDDELLVTISNYYTASVFYTNDGGASWISKDQANFGLPNLPVRSGIFNPLNTNQVLIATDLGVWSSNSFKNSNPNWESSNNQLANVRCEMLKYRDSDGLVAVATFGRGVFVSDIFEKNNNWINLKSGIWKELDYYKGFCKGINQIINFDNSNNFGSGNVFNIELSDVNGNFSNPLIIGSGSNTSINAIFPSTLASGSGYKIRIASTNPVMFSNISSKFQLFTNGTVSINPQVLCSNNSITIFSSIFPLNSQANYSWVGPNGFTSNQKDIDIINGSSNFSGVYTVNVNFLNECQNFATSTANIILNTSPIISVTSNTPFTQGQTVRFDFSSFSGRLYIRTPDGSYFSTARLFLERPNSNLNMGGNYRFYSRSVNGCWNSTKLPILVNSNCIDNQIQSNTIYTNTNIIKANQSIVSNKWIVDGANINFNSGKKVELNPGFEVKKGSIFKAQIGGCSN